MRNVVTAEGAIGHIEDGATVLINPLAIEEVFPAFARVYERTGSPKDLTIVYAAGIGPFSEERRGMNHFAVPGMIKRVIAGHVGLNYLLVKCIADNEVEAYNLPQGVMVQLYREIAAGRPGLVTKVGLGTFVDPRLEGGKMNERTRDCEDLVEVAEIDGEEYLRYKPFHVDVGIVRGSTVDATGNITCEEEALTMEGLEVAMAAKNCGGRVIAQVMSVEDEPAMPHRVHIPDVLVDDVVVASSRKTHPHTLFDEYEPAYYTPGKFESGVAALPLSMEKVIGRRAALELRRGMHVNLGVGIPMGVAAVASEEGLLDEVTLSTEIGVFGGRPEGGLNFGPAKHPRSIVSQTTMFNFYDGGGLDLTCVGLAQADREGNVNVSKLGAKLIGCGGFINLTQTARACLFCGEFKAGGFKGAVEEGRLVIQKEGKACKFVDAVEQITFSGKTARQGEQKVLFITERCVFRLVPEGMLLAEVAPGIDVQRDIVGQMDFAPIVPDEVPLMNPAIFQDVPMGL